MLKEEFAARAKRAFTDAEYGDIELVYMYHPSISNKDGKDQIAHIWDTFGPRLIADMLPTAQTALEYDRKIAAKRLELDELCKAYDKFCNAE